MAGRFYITTTLPYVNAEPHIGHAMEFIRADIIARYQKLSGKEVFFNIGTDEHGQKVYRKALELGIKPQDYVDGQVKNFLKLKDMLGLLPDLNFIRTTDAHHVKAAQEFWRICDKNGYIYKKNYKIKYCIGCELEKTDSELENGRCPIHPNLEIELIEEENYFFRFSQFGKKLLALYEERPDFVVPEIRLREIRAFVGRGLEDFSVSRLKEKMPWGIPVPEDDRHVMYVWFDALVNYVSAVGWPDDQEKFKKWWVETGGVVQYCGKDNLRQQSAMWQAMLMAAGLPSSKQIVIDGFITGEGGVKMSKSLGNVVDPAAVVNEYGSEALRYYVSRELHPFEDSPFSLEMFKKAYNANLANGLGNLVSRVMKMAVTNGVNFGEEDASAYAVEKEADELYQKQTKSLEKFDIQAAADAIWNLVAVCDREIQEKQPFKLVKTEPEAGKKIIERLLSRLYFIGTALLPIMPETADKIIECVRTGKMPAPLFSRKD